MKTKILLGLIIVLLLSTIGLCIWNYNLRNKVGTTPQFIHKVDTVYIDKVYTITKPYKEYVSPTKVNVYTKGLEKDTNLSCKDSVVQFAFDKGSLDLVVWDPLDSTVKENKFKIDMDNYKYLYSNGILTQSKKLNLKIAPYVGVEYKPFHKQVDLHTGISFKTKYMIYSLGYNLDFSNSHFKHDLEVSVIFNYNVWQK